MVVSVPPMRVTHVLSAEDSLIDSRFLKLFFVLTVCFTIEVLIDVVADRHASAPVVTTESRVSVQSSSAARSNLPIPYDVEAVGRTERLQEYFRESNSASWSPAG